MQTPKEKGQVILIVAGIVLSMAGVGAISSKKPDGGHLESDGAAHFDPDIAGAIPRHVAPWFFGAGLVSFVGAYLLRDR